MTAAGASPRQPAGLGAAGSALWKRLVGAYVFEPYEVGIVEAACRQADDIARLDAAIRSDGVLTEGSQGQPRLAQVVTEARQGREALVRLLARLDMPSEQAAGDKPLSAAGRRAEGGSETVGGRSRSPVVRVPVVARHRTPRVPRRPRSRIGCSLTTSPSG